MVSVLLFVFINKGKHANVCFMKIGWVLSGWRLAGWRLGAGWVLARWPNLAKPNLFSDWLLGGMGGHCFSQQSAEGVTLFILSSDPQQLTGALEKLALWSRVSATVGFDWRCNVVVVLVFRLCLHFYF